MVELAGLLGELTGRRLPQRTAPEWLLRAGSRLLDRVQRPVPVRLPISAEAVASTLGVGADVAVDDRAARQELGIERRELRQTLADTVRWLAEQGQLTARQAGALAG
jgi:dihydroflavonol-4-reductase